MHTIYADTMRLVNKTPQDYSQLPPRTQPRMMMSMQVWGSETLEKSTTIANTDVYIYLAATTLIPG